ncbi:hypothetical protein CPter91_0683 [Collimonas pratensis]|uniref:Uncharacterized protein n=1 Tax=Collimonas pratensis TaxID=279113 RepID=A0A127PZ60_9BURK|nr:hypothetical protein CPter91_0683 [Collimonas pratensis]
MGHKLASLKYVSHNSRLAPVSFGNVSMRGTSKATPTSKATTTTTATSTSKTAATSKVSAA